MSESVNVIVPGSGLLSADSSELWQIRKIFSFAEVIMRDYIVKSNKADYVPRDIYMQVKYRLKSVERLKSLKNKLLIKPFLSAGEKRLLKRIEKELENIKAVCDIVLQELSGQTLQEFEPLKAYFSYEHYNTYMKRSNKENDLGKGYKTWGKYKRRMTLITAERLKIV